jgi:hypothetical protein
VIEHKKKLHWTKLKPINIVLSVIPCRDFGPGIATSFCAVGALVRIYFIEVAELGSFNYEILIAKWL